MTIPLDGSRWWHVPYVIPVVDGMPGPERKICAPYDGVHQFNLWRLEDETPLPSLARIRCETPVGVACARCAIPITDTDIGTTMPGSAGPVAFHQACLLKSILPHDQWHRHGLVPDAMDGLTDGKFECRHCGMVYERGVWMRRLR